MSDWVLVWTIKGDDFWIHSHMKVGDRVEHPEAKCYSWVNRYTNERQAAEFDGDGRLLKPKDVCNAHENTGS